MPETFAHEDFKFGQRVRVLPNHAGGRTDIVGEIGGIAHARNAFPFVTYILLLDTPMIFPGELQAAKAVVFSGFALEKITEKLEPLPKYVDLITVEEFGDGYGYLGDGEGYWATTTAMSRESCCLPKPDWATHIAWFNK